MLLAAGWISSVFLGLFITLFILVSCLLILIVLIQKGRGGGLASAFGGGGGNTAFGSKTGDVLTWATSIIFGVFLLIAVILNLIARPDSRPVAAGTGSGTPAQQTTPSSTPDTNTPTPTTPAPTIPTRGDTATTPRPTTNPSK